MDEQIVGADPDIVIDAALTQSELVQDRPYPERREDVRRNLQTELAPDRPGLRVDRRPEVDLAAHDHRDELVGRGEVLLFDARRILRVSIVDWVAARGARALEVAEGGATSRVEERLDGGVGVLRRVVDLRDIVDCCDAIVELTEPSKELVDVDILRPKNGSKGEQNVLVISGGPGG